MIPTFNYEFRIATANYSGSICKIEPAKRLETGYAAFICGSDCDFFNMDSESRRDISRVNERLNEMLT